MKTSLSIILVVLFLSCSTKSKKDSIPESKNFDWIVGSWIRLGEAEGKITHETWIKKSDSLFLGEGVTLKENDTVFHENIRLSAMGGVWSFDVQMTGEVAATKFKVTKNDKTSFTCENPENEFPKVISYESQDSVLVAEISAGEMKIDFRFRKVK